MTFLGGVAKQALNPKIGTDLVGYSQQQNTSAIHDSIHARALVLSHNELSVALCSVEVCVIPSLIIKTIRDEVAQHCNIDYVFIFSTHTHAAPALHIPENWHDSPITIIADTIKLAYDTRQEVTLGTGFGQLYGYSINRRWLNRPIDPSVGVVRIDTRAGEPLALLSNFANHPVVLGYDNNQVSGDWPGFSSAALEAHFGNDFVALFGLGGAGDINPITEAVRDKLEQGLPVHSIGSISAMYGTLDDKAAWDISDRAGGNFDEVKKIASAYNAEIMRVWQSINPQIPSSFFVHSFIVNGTPDDDEPSIPETKLQDFYAKLLPEVTNETIPLEIMLVGCDSLLLMGQPGEVLSENAIALRKICQQMGILYPMLITCANGWYSYLVPENAYSEGGYEVEMAKGMGLSQRVQKRIWQAIQSKLLS